MANQQQSAMDDPEEKLQNLKTLSAVLLKENIERRQQVESLLQANENLEIQLAQIAAEKTEPKTESVRDTEETMKGMFSVFLENQMDTMGVLVRNLVRENGEKVNEINGLKLNIEVEREKFREKVIELEEKKAQFDEVRVQRDVAEEELAVKVKAIADLNRNLEETVRMQNGFRMRIENLIEESVELRNAVVELEESIKIQRDENKQLGYEVSCCRAALEQLKLEKDNAERNLDAEMKKSIDLMSRVSEMEKRADEMKSQVENLLEEKRGMECQVGMLREEKCSMLNTLSKAQREANDWINKALELEFRIGLTAVEELNRQKDSAKEVSTEDDNSLFYVCSFITLLCALIVFIAIKLYCMRLLD